MTSAQVLLFLLGCLTFIVALVSPLDPLGETLLTAHMIQHGILIAVAPPLLLLGRPGIAFAWALQSSWHRSRWSGVWQPLVRLGRWLARPLPAAALHGLALWGWHAPGLFDLAIAHEGMHRLEHASFFGTALLFWLAVLRARSPHRAGLTLGAALATLVHGGLLGALITMAPVPLYGWYHDRTEAWGMTQLADQQLAGLVMWVPMGAAYFAACLLLASRLLAGVEKPMRYTVGMKARPIVEDRLGDMP